MALIVMGIVFLISMWGTWYADTHEQTREADITALLRKNRKRQPERRLM